MSLQVELLTQSPASVEVKKALTHENESIKNTTSVDRTILMLDLLRCMTEGNTKRRSHLSPTIWTELSKLSETQLNKLFESPLLLKACAMQIPNDADKFANFLRHMAKW